MMLLDNIIVQACNYIDAKEYKLANIELKKAIKIVNNLRRKSK